MAKLSFPDQSQSYGREVQTGYQTKVQQIFRKNTSQFYMSFPQGLAQAMGFKKGEVVKWEVRDKDCLLLK